MTVASYVAHTMHIYLPNVHTEQFAHVTYICNLMGVIVSDIHIETRCEIDNADGYGAVYMCSNARSICGV